MKIGTLICLLIATQVAYIVLIYPGITSFVMIVEYLLICGFTGYLDSELSDIRRTRKEK